MKKTLLLLLFTTPILTFAQPRIKAGTNISSLNGTLKLESFGAIPYSLDTDYSEMTESKFGLYAGVGYNFNIKDKSNVVVELIYSQLGANNTSKSKNSTAASYEHNFLSMPLIFEYNLIGDLNVVAGAQFDYLIDSKTTLELPLESVTSKNTDSYKKIGTGITAGASYTFFKKISIEARYYLGLNNMQKDEDKRMYYIDENSGQSFSAYSKNIMKNRSIQLGLAYKF